MRILSLLPVLAAVVSILPASAAPLQMTTVVPLPGVGAMTLGLVAPTQLPSPHAPSAPGGVPGGGGLPKLPVRRSFAEHLLSRQVHNADFSASPNKTIPGTTTAAAASRKRDSHNHGHEHEHDAESGGPQGPAALASNAASGVKAVGQVPKQISHAANTVPVNAPDTPVSHADAPPSDIDPYAGAAPAPVNEEEVPAGEGSYPNAEGYKYTTPSGPSADGKDANATQKRHDFVLDTDPIMPPEDATGKDSRMGVVNMDSNRKPEDANLDSKAKTGKVALAGTDTATGSKPTATHTSDPLAAPTPTYKEVA